jgi:hypothetical protein
MPAERDFTDGGLRYPPGPLTPLGENSISKSRRTHKSIKMPLNLKYTGVAATFSPPDDVPHVNHLLARHPVREHTRHGPSCTRRGFMADVMCIPCA